MDLFVNLFVKLSRARAVNSAFYQLQKGTARVPRFRIEWSSQLRPVSLPSRHRECTVQFLSPRNTREAKRRTEGPRVQTTHRGGCDIIAFDGSEHSEINWFSGFKIIMKRFLEDRLAPLPLSLSLSLFFSVSLLTEFFKNTRHAPRSIR